MIALAFGIYSTFIQSAGYEKTTATIGHTEETDWNSLIIDNNNTFTLDGVDVWKHLRSMGVTINSRFGKAEGIMPSYDIRRDGELLARTGATDERGGSRRMLLNTVTKDDQ